MQPLQGTAPRPPPISAVAAHSNPHPLTDALQKRKIRCDGDPDGCANCAVANQACEVTDRVTGRTEHRGYLRQLERQIKDKTDRIRELERLLAEKGVEVRTDLDRARDDDDDDGDGDDSWTKSGPLWVKDRSADKGSGTFITPNFPRSRLESRAEDSSIAVGRDSQPLHSFQGTKITWLDITIDTAAFTAPDMDEPSQEAGSVSHRYNKSVQASLRSMMRENSPMKAELPARDTAFLFAEWYFSLMSGYFPVLHRPTFFKLVSFETRHLKSFAFPPPGGVTSYVTSMTLCG